MAITATQPKTINNGHDSAAKAVRPETIKPKQDKSTEEATKKSLHAKPETLPDKYVFKKIKADDAELTAPVAKLLNRFQINENATKYDAAVLSDDGNTLVIANRGEVGLKQLFGGTNGFTRTLYKIFGLIPRIFGAAHKAIAANNYKSMFNKPNIEEQGEPLKHVLSALKTGEYHTVTVFHKDPETGKFGKEPVAVAIIDAFDNLIEPNITREMKERKLPDEEIEKQVKVCKEKFSKYYSQDKLIPISKSTEDLKDISHQVIEGLYAAQGFDGLIIPLQVHPQQNINSNDLNYREMKWHYIKQNKDSKWNIVGDARPLDMSGITNKDTLEKYRSRMLASAYSPKITIVRPKEVAEQMIPPFLAYLQQWSSMSQGSELRTTSPEDLKLIEMTEPVNASVIARYNAKHNLIGGGKEYHAPWKDSMPADQAAVAATHDE